MKEFGIFNEENEVHKFQDKFGNAFNVVMLIVERKLRDSGDDDLITMKKYLDVMKEAYLGYFSTVKRKDGGEK